MRIYYSDKMVASSGASPSAGKPLELANRIKGTGLKVDFKDIVPLDWEDFHLSHGADFVDRVKNLRANNGFGTKSPIVRDSLPYTSGSLYCAALDALENKDCAWALSSGFHHAARDMAMAFCTFEGLTVAAKKLIKNGLVERAFILDGDAHWGNGCVEAITPKWANSVFYKHIGNDLYSREGLEKVILENKPQILFFQDGMDAYWLDPLGGFSGLTYAQLYQRMKDVSSIAKENGIPMVVNLGGGYLKWRDKDGQANIEPVLLGHTNSLIANLEVYEESPEIRAELGEQPWETEYLNRAIENVRHKPRLRYASF
jgi:acetoin utilization deacetylase AcuC-like enzyme